MIEVKGYEGLYSITEDGQIFSHDKPTGQKGRFLRQNKSPNGYKTVWLSKKGKVTAKTVHRIVAESFLKHDRNRKFVNHKNGIKTDNRVENLDWCTQLENNRHAWKSGLCEKVRFSKARGENSGMSKLTENNVRAIRNKRVDGFTLCKLAKEFKVSKSLISVVCRNEIWKHTV